MLETPDHQYKAVLTTRTSKKILVTEQSKISNIQIKKIQNNELLR